MRLETLEGRSLMAAGIFFSSTTGTIYIEGHDGGNDLVDIKIDGRGTISTADDLVTANLDWTNGATKGSFRAAYSQASVKSIVFNGYRGNDRCDNQTNKPSELDGGDGNDILLGGFANDVLYAGSGNDYLDGRTGNDMLYAGGGDDIVFGDKGIDQLFGGDGVDALFGGAGMDQLFGENGNDQLDGGPDTESMMHGGLGVDTFIDDVKSFPGGDFGGTDLWSTKHSAAGLFDYQISDDLARSSVRLQAYLKQTNVTPTPTPPPAPVNLNASVLAFAQGKLGQKVGDGGCTRLIEAALAAVGARPGSNLQTPGFYVWGRLLNVGEAMKPGNIIQFAPGTRFESPTSSLWMDSYFGHAAIIESVNGSTITILNQNMGGSPVIRTTIDLSTKKAGSFSVYQAIPK